MKPESLSDNELSELRGILSSPAFKKARAWVEYEARPTLAVKVAEGWSIQEAIVSQAAKDAGIYEAFEELENFTQVIPVRHHDPTQAEEAWKWTADPKDIAKLAELEAKAKAEQAKS